jgi:hypothetical protein
MNYFVPFTVKMRSNKENRKNKKEWPFKTHFPVIAMDVEKVSHQPVTDISQMQHPLTDNNEKQLVDGEGHVDLEMDEFDEEEMEDLVAKYNARLSESEQVRTWLLIANSKTGAMKWVTTEEIKFCARTLP